MSSWRRVPSQKRAPATLVVTHNSGFFSCCTVRLQKVIEYFSALTRPPTQIDSSQQFLWYKPADYAPEKSIIEQFFLEKVNGRISYTHPIMFQQSDQFSDYRKLPFADILPFVRRYFTVSAAIEQLVASLEKKYAIDYKNTCVLFYRGNDKATETRLAPYDDYLARAREILAKNPKTRFLIQSDETEFIDVMRTLPGSFYFMDETRSISRCNTSVDLINKSENYEYALHFLAITIIMSRCSTVVFGSGNCSLWIVLFREGTAGIQQYLEGKWLT